MRYDPAAWEKDFVNTEDLMVDLQNPRFAFRRLQSVDDVVQYLVARESVLDLAAKISDYGALFDNERIIILRQDDGKLVVLEGNRRTIACQILLRPGKYFHDYDIVDTIPVIDEETRRRISIMEVSIVRDRRIADPVIANIHVFGKKDWNYLSKVTYAFNNFHSGVDVNVIARSLQCSPKDIHNLVRAYTAIDLAREALGDDRGKIDLLFSGDLDLQNFARIVLSPVTGRHFGAPMVWENGQSNFLNHEDLLDKIRKIIGHTIFPENDGEYRLSHGAIEAYLEKVFPKDIRQMDLGIVPPVPYRRPAPPSRHAPSPGDEPPNERTMPDEPKNVAPEDSTEALPPLDVTRPASESASQPGNDIPQPDTNSPQREEEGFSGEGDTSESRQRVKTREMFFEELECRVADFRLRQLTKEIVNVSKRQRGLVDFAITASFLMRALLEWSLLYHVRRLGRIDHVVEVMKLRVGYDPSLTDLLQYVSKHNDGTILPRKLSGKAKFIFEHWMNDLNCNVHNDFGNHTVDRLAAIAADARPIIKYIFGYRDTEVLDEGD